MDLIASFYESDSEVEPLAEPFNLVELPGDLLNGMLSGRSSNWTEQDASPLGAVTQLDFPTPAITPECLKRPAE